MKNLNLLFNKLYYECLGTGKETETERFKTINSEITGTVFNERKDFDASPLKDEDGYRSFCMKTAYPGLLIGTGYMHGSNIESNEEDVKMGFSFDYTTGQPYIPGSTVKGVLRSACKKFAENPDPVITAVFERGKDVFLDAVIIKGGKNGRVLGEDYITPHPDAISAPKPIKMIKILPDVAFEFRFLLCDDCDDKDKVGTADEKIGFFKDLLAVSGVGAKTHVGYGALEYVDYEELRKNASDAANKNDETAVVSVISAENGVIETGKVYTGVVQTIKDFGAFVSIDGSKKTGLVHKSEIANEWVNSVEDFLSEGQRVRVKVIEKKADGKISLSIKKAGNEQ